MNNFYLVQVDNMGAKYLHPEVGHDNYGNAGYSPDKTECIWVAKKSIDLIKDAKEHGVDDMIIEISEDEAYSLLEEWRKEKESVSPPEGQLLHPNQKQD